MNYTTLFGLRRGTRSLWGDSSLWLANLCNRCKPFLTCLPQDTTAQQMLYG